MDTRDKEALLELLELQGYVFIITEISTRLFKNLDLENSYTWSNIKSCRLKLARWAKKKYAYETETTKNPPIHPPNHAPNWNSVYAANRLGENVEEQAGAELGQAQLKLGLGFTSTTDSK